MKLYAVPGQTEESVKALASQLGQAVSLVGAGGKSTWLYALAECLAGEGKRILVTTTTRIYIPREEFLALTAEEVHRLWQKGTFAVLGTPLPEQGKLSMPNPMLLDEMMQEADMTLIEADGSRHCPIKVPRAGEPVILPQTDTVIAVMGMSALGKPLEDGCFGLPEAVELLSTDAKHLLTEEDAAQILASPIGGRKTVGDRRFLVILNQCEEEMLSKASKIAGKLNELGIREVYASAFSRAERDYYTAVGQGK